MADEKSDFYMKTFKYFGDLIRPTNPAFEDRIRPVNPASNSELERVAKLADPSQRDKLTPGDLRNHLERGYTFGDKHGMVVYVAEDIPSGELVAKGTAKTWTLDNLKTWKYRITESGGVEAVSPAMFLMGDENPPNHNVVELTGIYVAPPNTQSLDEAIAYGVLNYIRHMQREVPVGAVFSANVGRGGETDDSGISHSARLLSRISDKHGVDVSGGDLSPLYGKGELLTGEEVKEVFRNLPEYRLGDPKTTPTAKATQSLLRKLADDEPLKIGLEKHLSPIRFGPIEYVHAGHLGSYVVARP